jgi:hypothetical protein
VKTRGIAEDMVLQGEAAEDEQEVAAPLREVGGLEVQNKGNTIPYVLDGGGLVVEPSDGRGVRGEGVGVIILGVVVSRTGVARAAAKGGGPLLQEIGLCALTVKGVGGGADPVLGGGGGLEEVGVLLQLLPALGVGGAQGSSFVFQQLGGGEGLVAELGRGGGSRGAGSGFEMSPIGAAVDMRAARARVEKGGAAREQAAQHTSRRRGRRGCGRRGGEKKGPGVGLIY